MVPLFLKGLVNKGSEKHVSDFRWIIRSAVCGIFGGTAAPAASGSISRSVEEGYSMKRMSETYDIWLDQVRDALTSINMHIEDWQGIWPFDFGAEYKAGTNPDAAA